MEQAKEPLERLVKTGLLYDFYGGLLTSKQRQAVELYYLENWSLAEIAAQEGVSRQAIHDLIQRSERTMLDFEAKLGLLNRFMLQQAALSEIRAKLNEIEAGLPENNQTHLDLSALSAKITALIETE